MNVRGVATLVAVTSLATATLITAGASSISGIHATDTEPYLAEVAIGPVVIPVEPRASSTGQSSRDPGHAGPLPETELIPPEASGIPRSSAAQPERASVPPGGGDVVLGRPQPELVLPPPQPPATKPEPDPVELDSYSSASSDPGPSSSGWESLSRPCWGNAGRPDPLSASSLPGADSSEPQSDTAGPQSSDALEPQSDTSNFSGGLDSVPGADQLSASSGGEAARPSTGDWPSMGEAERIRMILRLLQFILDACAGSASSEDGSSSASAPHSQR